MFRFHELENEIIAELTDENLLIAEVQDALDLMGDAGSHASGRIIIREKNLHTDFFILSTRLAGDILQKFSNYNVKLAIIGDFSKYESKSLKDFIRESNKGNRVFFVDTLNEALCRLANN